jgi:hypothetical protein
MARERDRSLRRAQLGVDAARGEPLLDRGRVQLLRDGQDADQLVGALPGLHAHDGHDVGLVRADDDVRAGQHRQLQIAVVREVQQALRRAAAARQLRDLDVLARMGPERQLFGRQVADRRLVGGDRPAEPRELRQRVGARLDTGRGLANQPVEIGGRAAQIVGRRSSQREQRQRGEQSACDDRDATEPFHAEARICPWLVSRRSRGER